MLWQQPPLKLFEQSGLFAVCGLQQLRQLHV
jgi:hypothetical protein